MPTIPPSGSASTSGTLQNAATTTGAGTQLPVLGMGTVEFTVTITGGTATVTFQGSEDGSTLSSILATQEGTNTTSTIATASGVYKATCAGLQVVQATITAIAGATITVTAHAVPGVSGGTVTAIVQGNVASLATDSGNPVKVGGVYNSSPPAPTTGQRVDLQTDANGALRVNPGPLSQGTDSVTNYPFGHSYAAISTATTTTVKSGAGVIRAIQVLGGTLGAITVYDNTAASGTLIAPTFTPTATLPNVPILQDIAFGTGLTIVTAAATIISVAYR